MEKRNIIFEKCAPQINKIADTQKLLTAVESVAAAVVLFAVFLWVLLW